MVLPNAQWLDEVAEPEHQFIPNLRIFESQGVFHNYSSVREVLLFQEFEHKKKEHKSRAGRKPLYKEK